MTDDITFCGNDCDNTKCRRHKSNIKEPQYPHSIALLEGTECCEKKPTSKFVRLIDADKLKKAFKDQECWNVVIAHIIDNAPTVEPTFGLFRVMFCETCQAYATNRAIVKLADEYTRPKGEWKLVTEDKVTLEFIYRCSECGREVSIYNTSRLTEIYPFCHCGADMRKGDTE